MTENIILTTGVYDLIKDHIRRKKVTKAEEEILTKELKFAKQILRKDIPNDIVNINKLITIKANETTKTFSLVGPKYAKQNKNKYSVLSDIGIAIVGYRVGDIIKWPTENGEILYEILQVEDLQSN